MVPALDLAALTTLADRVVVAEVLSVQSQWEHGRRRIFTTIEVQISETWKGQATKTGKLVIGQPGGVVGDIEQRVFGLAEFHVGQRAVMFLKGAEDASAVVGLGQGMRPMRFDQAARRWMVDAGDRTAAVMQDRDGRFGAAPPLGPEPLETLRSRVRALVQP